ncbi:MAG: hypothetical protein HYS56_00380 [Candidatus Omnitrophica bacterium]|nr:hypothetical protein [Candidatus Omnitrophota bacterium]
MKLKSLLLLSPLVMILGWWRIADLGDLRFQLPSFFFWFFVIAGFYAVSLWVIQKIGTGSLFDLGVLLTSALVMRLLLLPTTPVLSDDIYRYVWDGKVQAHGINPYRYPPNAENLSFLRDDLSLQINHPHLRTIYPPLAEWAFRLGNRIGPTITAQKIVFGSADLLIIGLLLALLHKRRRSLLWAAAYAWNPLVILETFGSGHNDSLGILFLWLGLIAWEYRRQGMALASWGLVFLSKYAALFLFPWGFFRFAFRRWIGLFALIVTVPFWIYSGCLSSLIQDVTAVAQQWQSNASLYALLGTLLHHSLFTRILCGVVWIAAAFWAARRFDDPLEYLFWVIGAAALLTPVLHPWYLMWLIPFLCFFPEPAWIAFSGTVVLSYSVWPRYLSEGIWELNPWIQAVEYLPLFLIGGWRIYHYAYRRDHSSVQRSQVAAAGAE